MESVSIVDPQTCCFLKVLAYEFEVNAITLNDRISCIEERFNCSIKEDIVRRNFPKIKDVFKKLLKDKNRKQGVKEEILKTFSFEEWNKLVNKSDHTLTNCQGCSKEFSALQSEFPAKKLTANKVHEPVKVASKTDLLNKAKELYSLANAEFQLQFPEHELIDILVDVPELKIKKDSWESRRNESRQIARKIKKSIEEQKNETAVLRAYGTDISLSKRNELRMTECFESKQECLDRSFCELKKIESGEKEKKDHVGVLPEWNEKQCFDHINSLPDGTVINFSALAKEYKLLNSASKTSPNAGQILKEVLMKKNINFDRLSYRGKTSGPRFRRRKRKLNEYDVSMPCDITNEAVKEKMQQLVLDGTYTAGEPIIPQTFLKHTVDKNSGRIVTEEFTVSGRKLSLEFIRAKHFEKFKQFYRVFSDLEINEMNRCDIIKELDRINELKDELLSKETTCLKEIFKKFNRTRHLQFWHDGSCISNHSHLLLAVNIVYDPAIFYTNEEFCASNGKQIDIQSEIESPFVYLVARCPGDDHQLMYSDIRIADIKTLKETSFFCDIEMYDQVRFFHGDGPACELEVGQQKNGHFPCWLCPANFDSSKNGNFFVSIRFA